MKLLKVTCVSFLASIIVSMTWAKTESEDQRIVKEALQAIELCLHWGGETAYDEERAKDISEGIDRDCPEAHKKALEAHKLFPDNQLLAEPLLSLHDFGYFDLSKDEQKRLCELAVPAFTKEFHDMKFENPFVKAECPEQAREIYGR